MDLYVANKPTFGVEPFCTVLYVQDKWTLDLGQQSTDLVGRLFNDTFLSQHHKCGRLQILLLCGLIFTTLFGLKPLLLSHLYPCGRDSVLTSSSLCISCPIIMIFCLLFCTLNTDSVKWPISEFLFYSFFIRCFNYHFFCLKPFDSLCSTVWQECDWFSCWIPPFWLCDVQYALFDVWNTVAFLPNLM